MKWIAPIVISAVVSAAQSAAPPKVGRDAPPRPLKQYSIEQFLNTTSITGASFSPDESRLLFSSNKTGIWNAYTVPVAGGRWTSVTTSTKDSTFAVSYLPERRPRSDYEGPGWQRAESPVCHRKRRRRTRSDARREAQGGIRRLGARRLRVLRHLERARSQVLRRLSVRREELCAVSLFREHRRLLPGRSLAGRQMGVSDESEHHERQ